MAEIRLVPSLAHQHPGAHERVALRRGVRQHVQQNPGQCRRGAEADPDRQDAHVLDAGVRQQPLDVALAEQVQRGQQQRRDPENQQHVAGKRRPERRLGHLVDSAGSRRS